MRKIKPFRSYQRGAVLVVSMLLLLVMTILALSISQTTTLEERMAGNTRDMELAFQASEAGVRAGELRLTNVTDPVACGDLTTCDSLTQGTFGAINFSGLLKTWWDSNGVEYGLAGSHDITEVTEDPKYVVRVRGRTSDTLVVGGQKVTYYEITSRSYGKTDTSQAVVQSVYAKRTLH